MRLGFRVQGLGCHSLAPTHYAFHRLDTNGSGRLDPEEFQVAVTSLGIDKQKMSTDEFKELLRNTFEDKFFSPHEPTLPPDKLRVWKQTEARMGTHSLCFRAFFLLTYVLFFLFL
jgi:hypothetical protein